MDWSVGWLADYWKSDAEASIPDSEETAPHLEILRGQGGEASGPYWFLRPSRNGTEKLCVPDTCGPISFAPCESPSVVYNDQNSLLLSALAERVSLILLVPFLPRILMSNTVLDASCLTVVALLISVALSSPKPVLY